jgi:hypothetical protein
MKAIETALRACVDKYVMLQPRPGVSFNIATMAPPDGISFDEDHPFPATTIQQDRDGRSGTAMIQIPILMGKLVERFGCIFLRVMDEAGNSGRHLLMAVDPDAIVAITVLADVEQDPPKVPPAPQEPSRIVIPG